MLTRTGLLFTLLVFLFSGLSVKAQQATFHIEHDRLFHSERNKDQLKGYLGQRLNQCYENRIVAQDAPRLIEPFKHRTEERCWQTEFWGKWFTSAVLAYQYRPGPALKAKLDKAVNDLLATQSIDGYIGNYSETNRLQQWDIWGRKYCLLGLLAYYDITKDKRSLQAAQRLTDHLMKELNDRHAMIVRQGNHRGMAASSVLEPVCLLYTRTGEKKYLDFALDIVRQWETPDGPQLLSKADVNVGSRFPKPDTWWGWEQGQKAYEMMSCYEGLLELYRITGRNEYKEAVEKTWKNILATEINVAGSGAAVETWFGGKELQIFPIKHYQETCVTATWIKLSQQLLRLTGEAKYADAIEQSYYNALLGAMTKDGSSWAKYLPLMGIREEGEMQCDMGLNCCIASGPRGLFSLPGTLVMSFAEGVQVNFFSKGHFRVQTPGKQKLEITQETNYPVEGTVILKLKIPKEERFLLNVRIPFWSSVNTISVNGEAVTGITPGTNVTINRKWKDGDEVKLKLDTRGRVVRIGKEQPSLALMRGPLLLSRDMRLGGPAYSEIISPVVNKDGFCDVEPAALNHNGLWTQWKVPFKIESVSGESSPETITILLSDYASAGNTMDEKSRFTVWFPQLVDPAAKK